MVAGAPRKISFLPEEMILLGQEMVKWIEERQDKVLHLSQWYTIEKMFTYKQWKTFIQREEFIPYYEKALKLVGSKYLDKDSNVRNGISERWMRIYFGDLRESEDADFDADAARKKEADSKKDQNINVNITNYSDKP